MSIFRFFDNVFERKAESMLVDLEDGSCPLCGGQMEITDADEVSLDADCAECCESIHVEIDYLNDGGIKYWPEMMAELEEED